MNALAATPLADDGVDYSHVGVWLNDPSNWTGPSGLLVDLRTHVYYTIIAVVVALVIALPLGLLIGHTGRGAAVVGGLANALRAVPALGLLVMLVLLIAAHWTTHVNVPQLAPNGVLPYLVSVEIVLIVLAIPPILTNTYAGVQNVDPAARDAARGMGMKGSQVVWRVELPNALPLIMSGVRSATLQVIATATIAAYAPFLGGLGAPILGGASQLNNLQHGYSAMVGAGIVVAVLAVAADLLLAAVQWLIVSPGITGRGQGRSRRRPGAGVPAEAAGPLVAAGAASDLATAGAR